MAIPCKNKHTHHSHSSNTFPRPSDQTSTEISSPRQIRPARIVIAYIYITINKKKKPDQTTRQSKKTPPPPDGPCRHSSIHPSIRTIDFMVEHACIDIPVGLHEQRHFIHSFICLKASVFGLVWFGFGDGWGLTCWWRGRTDGWLVGWLVIAGNG